jgi:hypothetical protein
MHILRNIFKKQFDIKLLRFMKFKTPIGGHMFIEKC